MDLYKLKENQLEQIEKDSFKLEKDIQSLVENNFDSLFNLEFVSTEFTIGEFRLDSLCYDTDTNSFVIVEYKKGSSYSVIDQGYSYLSVMINNKSDFILEYIERKGKNLKKSDVDWSQSRIIFISPSFNSYQKNSINFKDVPFELWEIKKFTNGIIGLNQHKSSSKVSIKNISSGKNTIINDVNKEVQVYTEEDTLNNIKVVEKIQELYFQLKDRVISWEDIIINSKKRYISFKKGKKTFVFLHFRQNYIRSHILISYKDSKLSFKLDDPKSMFSIFENDYKKMYSYDLKDPKDLDYFLIMIKQKYDDV